MPSGQLVVSRMDHILGTQSTDQPVMIPPPDACGSFEVSFEQNILAFLSLFPDPTNTN